MSSIEGGGASANGAAMMFAMAKMMVQEDRAAAAERERDALRAEAAELAEGERQAEELHDAASQTMLGAFMSGSLTAIGGVSTVHAGAQMSTKPGDEALRANEVIDRRAASGRVVAALGQPAGKLFDAGADHDRANAAEHEARARAHGHEADRHREAARTLRQTDQELLAAVRDAAQNEHAGLMAILSAR